MHRPAQPPILGRNSK